MAIYPASEIPHNLASNLRDVFDTGLTRPLSWRLAQIDSLLRMFEEREDDFFQALGEDLGKSPHESFYSEILYLKSSLKYTRKNLKKWVSPQKMPTPLIAFPSVATVIAEPLGVILVIAPWNYPLTLAIDPLVGAIAAGNTVVLKPSELAPACSKLLAKLLPVYLDQTAVQVIQGGVKESTLLLEQKWDKIFFTGSAAVGKIVMAAACKHLTPVILELGGKCPVLIDSTADLDITARRVVFGKWGATYGQACIAPDYVLVESSISSALISKIKKTLLDFYGEDPRLSKDHSRVVNLSHLKRVRSFLEEDSISKTIIHGGECDEASLYIAPTVLLNPPTDSRVMKEEIFGPILPILEVKSMDDALNYVKLQSRPIAAYVFSGDKKFQEKAAVQIQAGSVVINDAIVQFTLDGVPFGGVGESGNTAYHGKFSVDAFSHPKLVLRRFFLLDIPVRYPPFSDVKKIVARKLMEYDYVGAVLAFLGIGRTSAYKND